MFVRRSASSTFLLAILPAMVGAVALYFAPAARSGGTPRSELSVGRDCDLHAEADASGTPGRPLEWYKAQEHQIVRDPNDQVAICFAEGTPGEVVAYVTEGLAGEHGQRYYLTGRWPGISGDPVNLTWSFVPDGMVITNPNVAGEVASPSNLFATMDTKFASQGGRATWILRFQQVFDRWAEVTGNTYTRITVGGNDWDDGAAWGTAGSPGLRGDVRISMHAMDGASNVLAYNRFPTSGTAPGDMVMDDAENWSTGSAVQHRFLRNVVAHEHGHGLGILHVCPVDGVYRKLMEPFVSTNYDGIRHDDIRAAHRQYGDDGENNDSDLLATNLGAIAVGTPVTAGNITNPISQAVTPVPEGATLSIDTTGDLDWFKFSVSGPVNATVEAIPIGTTYDSSQQACSDPPNANCCSGSFTNSRAQGNLNLDLIDTDGFTVLASGNAQPTGTIEYVSNVNLDSAGIYYVKVSVPGALAVVQLYKLRITLSNPPCTTPTVDPIAADSTVCGSPYSSGAPTSAGTPPFTWSIASGGPPGMTIDSGTGIVSWPSPVASATPYLINLQADNACGNDTDVLSLTVAPGDFDGDGLVDDTDIATFTDHLLGNINTTPCAADCNNDGNTDALDIQCYVDQLL